MAQQPIPDDIRRFVLTSIPSVPHLEALLLLRAGQADFWRAATVAERLYIGDKVAHDVLVDLCRAGMIAPREPGDGVIGYRYQPSSDAMRALIDRLAALYGSDLLEVTYLIHSALDRKAHLFADAFKWRKDP
jgi:hypothetical protein